MSDIPHPTAAYIRWHCRSCEAEGEAIDAPTFCPACGSTYVYEDFLDDGDGEPKNEP